MIVNDAIKKVIAVLATQTFQIAVGTGSTPPWVDNKTLEHEYARQDATVGIESKTLEGDTLKLTSTFTFSEVVTISEYGVFHKDTNTMICRQVITPIYLAVSRPLEVIFHIQLMRG